ncbi:arsenate reductase family protein [Luteolibacter sp. AS25]|uniref:arsenate reductase family protein n=1 Tax=Luteolibacter sp. AS25 TaxID=3135776 RepID=UPI00398B2C1F
MKIFTLKTCDSCRKATKFLKENDISFTEIPIRETPPSLQELRAALESTVDLRKLFNTSGQDYRSLNLKETLPTLSEEAALELLASNGNLIKRPFLITADTTMVGFKPEIWQETLVTGP